MYGQVTPLDRPLPPGEGRGEGFIKANVTLDLHWSSFLPELPSAELVVTKPQAHLRLGNRPILAQIMGAANGSGTLLLHVETLR